MNINKKENFLLVSSHYPSGVAWLANFLIDIGIPIYRYETGLKSMWHFVETDHAKLIKKEYVLKRWLPSLSNKRIFYFPDDCKVRWTHEFPNCKNINQKTILFIRDGRDAIYSHYKKQKYDGTFKDMLKEFTHLTGLPHPETWALYNYLWMNAVSPQNLFIISFEEVKKNPVPVLKRLITFLGVKRSDKLISASIEASSFEKAKKSEREFMKNNLKLSQTVINRRGMPNEWKETFSKKELKYFYWFPNKILKLFNYQPICLGVRNHSPKLKLITPCEEVDKYINLAINNAKSGSWSDIEKNLHLAMRVGKRHNLSIIKINTVFFTLNLFFKIYLKGSLKNKNAFKIFNLILNSVENMLENPAIYTLVNETKNLQTQNFKLIIFKHNIKEIARILLPANLRLFFRNLFTGISSDL